MAELIDGDPHVEQPDAGDAAANVMVQQVAHENGITDQKEILLPEGCPGQEKQEDAQLQAKENQQEEEKTEHAALRRGGG